MSYNATLTRLWIWASDREYKSQNRKLCTPCLLFWTFISMGMVWQKRHQAAISSNMVYYCIQKCSLSYVAIFFHLCTLICVCEHELDDGRTQWRCKVHIRAIPNACTAKGRNECPTSFSCSSHSSKGCQDYKNIPRWNRTELATSYWTQWRGILCHILYTNMWYRTVNWHWKWPDSLQLDRIWEE